MSLSLDTDDDVEALPVRRGARACRSHRRLRNREIAGWGCSSRRATGGRIDLGREVLRHFGAIGFVLGELLLAFGLADAFEDRGHIFGLEGLRELADHVVEDEDGFGGGAREVRMGGALVRARAW